MPEKGPGIGIYTYFLILSSLAECLGVLNPEGHVAQGKPSQKRTPFKHSQRLYLRVLCVSIMNNNDGRQSP